MFNLESIIGNNREKYSAVNLILNDNYYIITNKSLNSCVNELEVLELSRIMTKLLKSLNKEVSDDFLEKGFTISLFCYNQFNKYAISTIKSKDAAYNAFLFAKELAHRTGETNWIDAWVKFNNESTNNNKLEEIYLASIHYAENFKKDQNNLVKSINLLEKLLSLDELNNNFEFYKIHLKRLSKVRFKLWRSKKEDSLLLKNYDQIIKAIELIGDDSELYKMAGYYLRIFARKTGNDYLMAKSEELANKATEVYVRIHKFT